MGRKWLLYHGKARIWNNKNVVWQKEQKYDIYWHLQSFCIFCLTTCWFVSYLKLYHGTGVKENYLLPEKGGLYVHD